MLILPFPPRRAFLRSFWLVLSLSVGIIYGLFLTLTHLLDWWETAVLLTVAMAIPGVIWSQMVIGLYRFWNRLMLPVGRGICVALLGLCYFTVFVVARLSKISLHRVPPTSTTGSFWIPRGILAPGAYAYQCAFDTPKTSRHHWVWTYVIWVKRSGHWWAVCLLPFLMLLAIIDPDRSSQHFQANIYTLF
jgi:hypothetical protein